MGEIRTELPIMHSPLAPLGAVAYRIVGEPEWPGVRTNLCLRSQEFDDAAWTKRGSVVVTANQATAPDGTMTADLLQGLDVGTNDIFNTDYSTQSLGADGARYSASVYIKKISGSGIVRVMNPTNAALGEMRIDLGLLSSGWERVTSAHPAVTLIAPFALASGGLGGILLRALTTGPISFHLWGAQLETGPIATPYIKTTTAARSSAYFETRLYPFSRTNLILQSQAFQSWTQYNGGTVSPDSAVAPDGTSTADKLIEGTGAAALFGAYRPSQFVPSGTCVLSVYAKAGERTRLSLVANNGTSYGQVRYNLSSGVVVAAFGNNLGNSGRITNVGGGWYKLEAIMTFAGPGSGAAEVRLEDSAGNTAYTGDGTSGLYLWGAQLETGPTATSYIPTTTTAVTVTDYQVPVPGRSNLLTYSEVIGKSPWTFNSASVTANAGAAPDGATTADKLVPAAASDAHSARQVATVGSGIRAVASVWAKAAGYSKLAIREGNTTGAYAAFDLASGTVLAQGAGGVGSVEAFPGGWYRVSMSFVTGATARMDLLVQPDSYMSGSVVLPWTADGVKGVLVWGAQLEQSGTAGPYVKTEVSALPVVYWNPTAPNSQTPINYHGTMRLASPLVSGDRLVFEGVPPCTITVA